MITRLFNYHLFFVHSEDVAECQKSLKSSILRKFLGLLEKVKKGGKSKVEEEIYTELYLVIKESREVSREHELRQIEAASRKSSRPEKIIQYRDIFKTPPRRETPIQSVLTTGVSGIGKTLMTEKFSVDWAEGKANKDIQLLFPFTFRELNELKDKKFSLMELIQHFFPEIKDAEISNFEDLKVAFIFDGLDESRLPLNFHTNATLKDIAASASVDVLLTNLINRNLLPSARLWLTTRPSAANQIPVESVDMVTEVLGFNDAQKLDYFQKKCSDNKTATKMMSYIKTSQTLDTVCHIPICCWIMATVIEEVFNTKQVEELPKTLTELYIHFLLVQSKMKNTNDGKLEWTQPYKEKILNLGKLAFEKLKEGRQIFYESDMAQSGISLKTISLYMGMFTEVFKEDTRQNKYKVFSFTHLSVQEFFAALYCHLTYVNSEENRLDDTQSGSWMNKLARRRTSLHHSAVDKAVESPNGHLDLFLHFIIGLSLPNTQNLLTGLQKKTNNSQQTNQKIIKYIKNKLDSGLATEKTINLFHCLNDLNDHSLVEEIQQFMSSGSLSVDSLSPAQWSALVFILLSSEKEIEKFDLKKYCASEEAFLRLLPVLKTATRAL